MEFINAVRSYTVLNIAAAKGSSRNTVFQKDCLLSSLCCLVKLLISFASWTSQVTFRHSFSYLDMQMPLYTKKCSRALAE